MANLFEYEEKVNPHPATVDSNPFDVADVGGGKALVADAGGNSILLVGDGNSNSDVVSRVKLVATLPNELVSTANAKAIFGCPTAAGHLRAAADDPRPARGDERRRGP